ncbi:RNA polymerase sigma factor RpoE ['Osedax' symbiont bacterium Rs2_46_30_T18]|nr:RNA polymerase sigma factor RpoE ['Osedax' symbiont bacterium Rs2_46_30_T18]
MSGENNAEIDKQLVKRVQEGDKRAFDLLVAKYQHKIIALIGRYVFDQDEALDISQEAFIKAYRALPRFRGDSAFYTWLYRIAINTAKNHLVSRGRRPPDVDIDVADAQYFEGENKLHDLGSPESNLIRGEIDQVIKNVLNALPVDLRVALTLREFEDMSYEDISVIMDCPVGTVRSRIFRAREAIDKEVSPYLR